MRGQYIIRSKNLGKIIVPNRITAEGKDAFLKMLLRADATFVAGGGNFYVGLCNQVPDLADTLADLTSEPSSAGGYARLPITRDSAGWPDIEVVSEDTVLRSAVMNFAAAGADYSTAFSRLFLCNVLSGTSGILFSYSGPIATPLLITDGNSIDVQYELYL